MLIERIECPSLGLSPVDSHCGCLLSSQ